MWRRVGVVFSGHVKQEIQVPIFSSFLSLSTQVSESILTVGGGGGGEEVVL